jgi:hypothetical protein
MEFNSLLRGAGLDPREVAVMLHQPAMSGQKDALLAMVADAPHLFELYQDNHPKGPEATLKARKFASSFVVNESGEARFVGLYAIKSWAFQTFAKMSQHKGRQEMSERIVGEALGAHDQSDKTSGRAIFDLEPLSILETLKGRLVVRRPAGRAYTRLAENCEMPILRVDETAQYIPPLPSWDSVVLTALSVRTIPKTWALKMQEWRGVYHIVDCVDGARYVGSAYGVDNLIGRWQAHVAQAMGITAELAKRDPANFIFSILELLAPNASSEEVVMRESLWKERLGTRGKGGLNKN